MHKEKISIKCEIFRKKEPLIKHITSRINKEKHIHDKARYAEQLAIEMKLLLDCKDYNEESVDCINCQTVSKLRDKMANLILKTSVIFV